MKWLIIGYGVYVAAIMASLFAVDLFIRLLTAWVHRRRVNKMGDRLFDELRGKQ